MREDTTSTQPPSRPTREPFLSRVKIRNYKSIGQCDIALGPLTVLVGRNGAGKSNFLDALRFVVDGLQTSLDHAIKSRGGIDEVRRRSTGHPRNLAIQLEMNLSDMRVGTYEFEISARHGGGFCVKQEHLIVRAANNEIKAKYRVKDAEIVQSSFETMPPAVTDRLFLVTASGIPEIRTIYDALLAMGFYNMNPQAMKELQSPDAGELLLRDGSNIASVMTRLQNDKQQVNDRIKAYLATIVPGITEVARVQLGPRETLEFRQEVVGSKHPWRFYAASMSDGTLRALGALVAVTQLAGRKDPIKLVGIEEPESALHPAATGALMDALREAASHTQVVVTTHSPELVDQIDPSNDTLLVVASNQGNTDIAPVDAASSKAIMKHLYSPGELLRMDQLAPDEQDLRRQQQMQLFETEEE